MSDETTTQDPPRTEDELRSALNVAIMRAQDTTNVPEYLKEIWAEADALMVEIVPIVNGRTNGAVAEVLVNLLAQNLPLFAELLRLGSKLILGAWAQAPVAEQPSTAEQTGESP